MQGVRRSFVPVEPSFQIKLIRFIVLGVVFGQPFSSPVLSASACRRSQAQFHVASPALPTFCAHTARPKEINSAALYEFRTNGQIVFALRSA